MALYKLFFSPTGGTHRVADLLCGAWDCPKIEVDLSDPEQDLSALCFRPEDLCVVAVPSFEGRVPPVVLPWLKALRGNGARTIAAAVFGNRAYDDTLVELTDLLRRQGFRCCAATAAVAQHSVLSAYGAGRPDAQDAAELAAFSSRCREAFQSPALPEVSVPGNHPYRAPGGLPGLIHPVGGPGCTACGLCVRSCPVGAIPAIRPRQVDRSRCIACMRCVCVCPLHVRHANGALLAIGTLLLKKKCKERKENEFFLSESF